MATSLVVALVGVGGVLIGALVTAGMSLYAGRLVRQHEDRRWLMDKRMEVYTELLSAWNDFQVAGPNDDPTARLSQQQPFERAWVRCMLMATEPVQGMASVLHDMIGNYVNTGRLDPMIAGHALGQLHLMMRRDMLQIPHPKDFLPWVRQQQAAQRKAARAQLDAYIAKQASEGDRLY